MNVATLEVKTKSNPSLKYLLQRQFREHKCVQNWDIEGNTHCDHHKHEEDQLQNVWYEMTTTATTTVNILKKECNVTRIKFNNNCDK